MICEEGGGGAESIFNREFGEEEIEFSEYLDDGDDTRDKEKKTEAHIFENVLGLFCGDKKRGEENREENKQCESEEEVPSYERSGSSDVFDDGARPFFEGKNKSGFADEVQDDIRAEQKCDFRSDGGGVFFLESGEYGLDDEKSEYWKGEQ